MKVFRWKRKSCFVLSASILLIMPAVVVSDATSDAPTGADAPVSLQDNSRSRELSPGAADETAGAVNLESAAKSKIARGKYLVHHVAQCIQCHTPRDDAGALNESRLLQGAPIPIVGPRYAQPWAAESAWIAGLGSYDEAFVHYLLTHGRKPDGSRPKRPMPTFKMTDADATAVIAYLRSL